MSFFFFCSLYTHLHILCSSYPTLSSPPLYIACPPFPSFLTIPCLPYPPIPFSLATCLSFCLPSHCFLSLHMSPSFFFFLCALPCLDLLMPTPSYLPLLLNHALLSFLLTCHAYFPLPFFTMSCPPLPSLPYMPCIFFMSSFPPPSFLFLFALPLALPYPTMPHSITPTSPSLVPSYPYLALSWPPFHNLNGVVGKTIHSKLWENY